MQYVSESIAQSNAMCIVQLQVNNKFLNTSCEIMLCQARVQKPPTPLIGRIQRTWTLDKNDHFD